MFVLMKTRLKSDNPLHDCVLKYPQRIDSVSVCSGMTFKMERDFKLVTALWLVGWLVVLG